MNNTALFHQLYTVFVHTALDTGVPPPTEPLLPSLGYSSSFTRESIIAIAVGGGGTIVVLIVLIIIALVVCSNVRRRSRFGEFNDYLMVRHCLRSLC